VTCVAEPKVTGRAWPPTVAVAPFTKPVPVMVRAKAAEPAVTLDGLKLVMLGVGLTDVTVSEAALEVPPPGAGVKTVTLSAPGDAMSLA
jgi:hypothetical protein